MFKGDEHAQAEPFPPLSPIRSRNDEAQEQEAASPGTPTTPQEGSHHRASNRKQKTRTGSLLQALVESNPPLGAWQAISEDTTKAPTVPEIKHGSYGASGWSHEGQLEKRRHDPQVIHNRRLSRTSSRSFGSKDPTTPSTKSLAHAVPEEIPGVPHPYESSKPGQSPLVASTTSDSNGTGLNPDTGVYPNGYRFPKEHAWKQSCAIYGAAFWKFFLTIKGFLLTVYALNVVAWGAMIFFLLIPGATPAMCKSYPDCSNKKYSARQIWIENCSQILTALFCVTAFGLLPWRLRDFYFMIRYQAFGDYDALRKLAGFYRGWYRLTGSEKLPEMLGPPPKPQALKVNMFGHVRKDKELEEDLEIEIAALETNPAVPLPPWSMPEAPLTGTRARPTPFKSLAIMIWMYIANTLFQVGLCVVMWGFNRFQRNHAYFSALIALFIVMGCFTGIGAGIAVGKESTIIKEVEGIPVKDYDEPESPQDYHERMAKRQKKEDKKNKRKRQKASDLEKQGS